MACLSMAMGRRRSKGRPPKVSVFKSVAETPSRFSGSLCPTNLQEQKERFFLLGLAPQFTLRASAESLQKINSRSRAQIRYDYLTEARNILEAVKKKYGDGNEFLAENLGPRIDYLRASEYLAVYLKENGLEGSITVYWAPDLTCSARMMWHGPSLRCKKPEARKFSLIIKNNPENHFLRDNGIICLADHEIGTHYFRMLNDGLQPWFSDRKCFGLCPVGCREGVASEEGLAALNTLLHAKSKFLWSAALLYYTACKANEMTFRQLFDHLSTYVTDQDQRWRHVMRVKRSLEDPAQPGGYGNDQCYFEGAVEILRHLDTIDFQLMWSGRVCWDELPRIHRLSRMGCIRTPRFLKDIDKYKKTLYHIAVINGLRVPGIPSNPPSRAGRSPKIQPRKQRPQSRNFPRTPPPANQHKTKRTSSPVKSRRRSPTKTPSGELTDSPSPTLMRFDPASSHSALELAENMDDNLRVPSQQDDTFSYPEFGLLDSNRTSSRLLDRDRHRPSTHPDSAKTGKAQKITSNTVREIAEKYFT